MMRYMAALLISLAFITLSCLSTQAQMSNLPHTYSYPTGPASERNPLNQYSYSGTGFDSTLEYLQRKNEEAQERREFRERESRWFEEQNLFRSTPEQLSESYFRSRRGGSPYSR